jgi:hypothetical protein
MMKKMLGYGADRILGALAAPALILPMLLAGRPAEAAKIDITDCTDTTVGICSYDSKDDDAADYRQYHALSYGGTGSFQCHSNCHFLIMKCKDGICPETCRFTAGIWLDHGWGRGYYLLESLNLNGNKDGYSSKDTASVSDGTTHCPERRKFRLKPDK